MTGDQIYWLWQSGITVVGMLGGLALGFWGTNRWRNR